MKKVLVFVFIFVSAAHSSHAQYALNFYITFDSGFISTQQQWPNDTFYFNDSNWLYIDTVHYPNNQWRVGRPQKTVFDSAYSYPYAIITDTVHPCLPNDTSVFILKVPKNAWLGLIELSFRYKLNIDSGDIAKIEWSADTGLHWTNALTDSNGLFSFTGALPNLTNSTIGWSTIGLYPMYPPWQSAITPTDTFLLRFTFIADSNTAPRDGWMIDNIYMGYDGESVPIVPKTQEITLFPNPTITSLTISSSQKITTLSITNLLSQKVYSNEYNSEKVQVNVSALPGGIYFVKINGADVRKFVKE